MMRKSFSFRLEREQDSGRAISDRRAKPAIIPKGCRRIWSIVAQLQPECHHIAEHRRRLGAVTSLVAEAEFGSTLNGFHWTSKGSVPDI
jgi:hypothetical protein